MTDPTQRFSTRVENYIKYRPGYPAAVLKTLQHDCHLTPASVIADIGSGTGISTRMFLENGNQVFGVEPNADMRKASEDLLKEFPKFQSLPGRAEETKLPDQSIDFIIAGQAFHWFDQTKTRAEFVRILRPGGWVVLIWNDRETTSTPFLVAYEQLLKRYATDYEQVDHKRIDDATIARFFAPAGYKKVSFPNRQIFDFAGLKGRLLSSSYVPDTHHPNHPKIIAGLSETFQTHQVNGQVAFEYQTVMYYGQLT